MKALTLFQEMYKEKIVVYDPDYIRFLILDDLSGFSSVGEIEEYEEQRYIRILHKRVFYYVVPGEKTNHLLAK